MHAGSIDVTCCVNGSHHSDYRLVGDSRLMPDELAAVVRLLRRGRRILRDGVAVAVGDGTNGESVVSGFVKT